MTRYARDCWRRAKAALNSARHLMNMDPDSSASRAYYAAFHAVSALFALEKKSFSKHSQVRAAVHRELVTTGRWDESLGKAYDDLIDLREVGDYGGTIRVTQEQAEQGVDKAARIIEAVRQMAGDRLERDD